MEHMKNKAIMFMNGTLRDYVYGPRRWFGPLRIVFVVMVAFVASIVGSAFAHYMAPVPTPAASSGTFLDGYMHRYWFEVGAVVFIVVAMLTRRVFRALCAAYVRRLDIDDAILAGDVKPCAGDAGAKSAPSRSRRYAGSANGDYAGDADSHECAISESEGGDE